MANSFKALLCVLVRIFHIQHTLLLESLGYQSNQRQNCHCGKKHLEVVLDVLFQMLLFLI
jgi:hypothetical protein